MTEVRSKRVEAPEVRRGQILEAAKQCFRETGFAATKMSDIADRAGVSVGLLYRYFESKGDVILGIVDQDLSRQFEDLQAALGAHAGEPVDAVIRTFEQRALDRRRTSLMLEITAESMRNPKVRALAAEGQKTLRRLFHTRLASSGVSVDAVMAGLQMVAALYTGVSIQLCQDEGMDPTALMALAGRSARQIMVLSASAKR